MADSNMRETRNLEFKETITSTFLKTVSAFSNYDGGIILFGVDDDGNIKGLSDIIKACLDIENKINDTISPQPDYVLEPNEVNKTIKLIVKSGLQKPYLYKSKAYKRNDSATIEVDTLEFSRLVLEGKNISFEELPYKDQNLTFHFLEEQLEKTIQINSFNLDTLKTLNLYDNNNGYNNAAGLLADTNDFPGVDIIKFGESISIIQKRITFDHMSILEVSVGELQTARRLSRLLDAFYNTPAWQELTRELILNDRRFLYRFLAYLTEANLIDQPMSLERRGLVLYEYCKQYYPDYRTQASIAWIEAGMSLKKLPAEHVKTKRQIPPEHWEVIYGNYKPELRLCFLPVSTDTEHGYWFGFESEIQKIAPVFKART